MNSLKCAACEMNIEGQYLTVEEKNYHPNHFVCFECKQPIESNYRTNDGNPYCSPCYVRNFAKICFGCKEPIVTKVITAMDKTWHENHFVCTTCMNPLVGTPYMTKEDKPYCKKDYYEQFGDRCDGCNQIIVGAELSALGKKWHNDCFKCDVCANPITENEFAVRGGKPICSACKN